MGTVKSARERQAEFRARMAQEGKRSVTGIVHEDQIPDVMVLLQFLRDNPDYSVGLVRNLRTGRYKKVC